MAARSSKLSAISMVVLTWMISVAAFPAVADALPRGVALADFESGHVTLESYDPGQDLDPDAWELTQSNTHNNSLYSLRLYGNTWKAQPISPYPIAQGTVLSVAVYVESIGEMQAFGVKDSSNVLFYTFAGTQLPTDNEWEVAYQGAFPTEAWYVYMLPVGRDWYARYGYEPTLTHLIYVNDRDDTNRGVTIFDDVLDVTTDLPVPPDVEIVQGRQQIERLSADLFRVGVQFHAKVYDPDSDEFTYHWDFGDSTFSDQLDPYHEFLITSDHTYTVTLAVRDDTDMWGRDSAQVHVDPGQEEPPVRMNFVGDVMLARHYDDPGGLIDQHGPEWIFIPTRPMYGDAADINVCNLECPLTDEGTPHPTKSVVFRGRPTNVAGLVYAGIDLVSIGNNHIIDYGQRGMEETQEVLDAAGIRWSGADDDEYLAFQPTFWTENGIALCLLGMCNRTGREYNYQPFLDAAYNKPGFAYLIEPRLGNALSSVRALADIVIVQLHSGLEYTTGPGDFRGADGAWLREEPPFDAAGPVPGAPDFRFPTRPSFTDRQLRWRAVEEGADLVICHHAHVLQGFEVYNGVLIAHSLGNFVFDQSYAETFPSVVLYCDLDKDGFRCFTFRPAFIDDMVPQPATGQLGREILDRMADYSRELDTMVGVDPATLEGTIFLDPGSILWNPVVDEGTVALTEEDGWWVSIPIEREGAGTLSRILSIDGPGAAEVRVGREILWHGGFEAEGATLWNLNSGDEVYDGTIAHSGLRSLRQHRTPYNTGQVTTDLEGYPPTSGGTEFSVCGYLRTTNAGDAGFAALFFRGRGGQSIASFEAGNLISGTHDWTYLSRNMQVSDEAAYFNLRCHQDKPQSGDGYAWFDDLRLVEWEAWQPASQLPLPVPYPSNLRFIQVRLSTPSDSVHVTWEDVSPIPTAPGLAEDRARLRGTARLYPGRPNPFKDATAIEYLLPQPGRVRLEIFDISGRRVAVLADGEQRAGWHRVTWEARGASSGLYLGRLTAAGEVRTQKLVRLR